MTGWLWTRCRPRGVVHTARLHQSLTSLPPDERFKVLFLGRDEFSCSVLKQLHAAKGMARVLGIEFQGGYTLKRRVAEHNTRDPP
jgi:hypothetical protein